MRRKESLVGLKRPGEVALFRKVYGRQFVLISAYGPIEKRQQLIEYRLRHSLVPASPHHEIVSKAMELIDKDAREDGQDLGQNVRETFHLADVFIDGLVRSETDKKLGRSVTQSRPANRTNRRPACRNDRPIDVRPCERQRAERLRELYHRHAAPSLRAHSGRSTHSQAALVQLRCLYSERGVTADDK